MQGGAWKAGCSSAFFHQLGKLVSGFRGSFPIKRLTHAHNKIMRRQLVLIQPEPIADNALHIIAVMGAFGGLFADDQTKARMAERVVCGLGDLQQIAAASVFQRKNG